MKTQKLRKPRGIKLNGNPSLDMCPHCYAFQCDPMTMSVKFQNKIRQRLDKGQCGACGHQPCTCKSKL